MFVMFMFMFMFMFTSMYIVSKEKLGVKFLVCFHILSQKVDSDSDSDSEGDTRVSRVFLLLGCFKKIKD